MASSPTVESLEAEISELRARLERAYPTPSNPKNESVETYLKMAWNRMKPDVDRAANLFIKWTEQDSQVRESLNPLIEEAITARLIEYEAAEVA